MITHRSNHLTTKAMWNGSRMEQDDLGFAEYARRVIVLYQG